MFFFFNLQRVVRNQKGKVKESMLQQWGSSVLLDLKGQREGRVTGNQ